MRVHSHNIETYCARNVSRIFMEVNQINPIIGILFVPEFIQNQIWLGSFWENDYSIFRLGEIKDLGKNVDICGTMPM